MSGPRADPLPPNVAGRYEVVGLLGRGGMGVVYEATHVWTGRRVALKVLRAEFASDDDAVRRFQREARAGVQSAHPNIVEVLDMGRDPESGALFLAQELLEGEDLAARLARLGRLSLREATEVLIPAMDALHTAHRAGVVHRDVKPANLFLCRVGRGEVRAKVIDFGVASVADGAAVTRTGAPLGTPQYMAPEQARGARDVDPRADVWAMGAVWFEALVGRRPIDGASYHEVMARLLQHSEARFAPEDPVPAGVRDAVLRALLADREARHGSMAAFGKALLTAPEVAETDWGRALAARHAFEGALPGSPRPTAPGAALETLDLPASAAPLVSARRSVGPPAPSTRGGLRSWRAPAVGFAAVSLALVAASGASRPRPRSPTPPQVAAAVPTPDPAPRAVSPVEPRPRATQPAATPLAVDAGSFALARSVPPPRSRRAAPPPRSRPPAPEVNGAAVLEP